MNSEEAYHLMIQFITEKDHGNYASYGYDLYLPNLMRTYYNKNEIDESQIEIKIKEDSYQMLTAAWEFCRRGIIRPGITQFGLQSTSDGSAGNGYSITEFGKQWISEDNDSYVPTEPGRFSEMLDVFREKYGPGFHQRAQEAILCYGAHAYLSCCVMCGAASESILISIAIENSHEEDVLKEYNSQNGRSKIENRILNKINDYGKRELSGYLSLLKYWRDNSAHGRAVEIKENEAYTSLAILMRLSQYVSDNWETLFLFISTPMDI